MSNFVPSNLRSTTQIGGNRTWVNDAVSIPTGGNQGTSGLAGITRRQGGGVASSGGHGAGYVCRRCGKAGHFLPNCPTNGDPAYENKPAQNQKLMNTSQGSRKIVATLEGIETKNKTVMHNKGIQFKINCCFNTLHHKHSIFFTYCAIRFLGVKENGLFLFCNFCIHVIKNGVNIVHTVLYCRSINWPTVGGKYSSRPSQVLCVLREKGEGRDLFDLVCSL